MKLLSHSRWSYINWGVIIPGCILILFGFATLYSLQINQDVPDFSLIQRQGVAFILGAIVCAGLLFFDFRNIKDYAYLMYIFGIVLLVLLFAFGVTVRGTTGWFRIGGIGFQPIEFFKLVLIITLSKFFSDTRDINTLGSFLKAAFLIALPAFLIYIQPDMGSLFILVGIWFGYLIIMRLKVRYIVLCVLTMVIAVIVAWFFILEPYQKDRIMNFVNPERDIAGSGYNVHQSKIAIGSGSLLGRGLGLGSQSNLNFLPEQETDFIFAVVAESLGFLGGAVVIIIYTVLLWKVARMALYIKDPFGVLISFGVFFWFTFQGFTNIAMNIGLIPVFGIPLPFLSYGGSSLLSSIIALGLLQSISLYSPREEGI